VAFATAAVALSESSTTPAAQSTWWRSWLPGSSPKPLHLHAHVPAADALAQAGVTSCLLAPLLHLLYGASLPVHEFSQSMTTLAVQASSLEPWELSTVLWGWATLGLTPTGPVMAPLITAALNQLERMPVYEAVVSAWALMLLHVGAPGYS